MKKNPMQVLLEMVPFPSLDAWLEVPKVVQPNNSCKMEDKFNGYSATNCLGETEAKNNTFVHNGQLQYGSLDHTHRSSGDQNSY